MEIKRYDVNKGGSRLVVHNGVAYFTGHAAPKYETLREQTAALCKRYDELFGMFGLKKENILAMNAYLLDINEIDEFNAEWAKWIDEEHAPAGVAVEASPTQKSALGDNIRVELALIVAVDEDIVPPSGEIERFDVSDTGSSARLVIHNNVAYFTGHVSPYTDTLREQTRVCASAMTSCCPSLASKRRIS